MYRSPLQLCLSKSAVVVLGGPSDLELPGPVSKRSALIADLREHLDGDAVTVALVPSWEQLRAWVACAEGQHRACPRSVSRAYISEERGTASDREAMLLRALKVS